MKRNSFVFFSSYYDAIKNLPEDEQGQFYKILVEYILVGKQPKKLSQTSKACFLLVKPFLDNSAKRYDANVENGKKGGRPKKENTQSKTQTKPNENPSITQQKPKDNPNETQQKPKQNLNRIEKNNNRIEIYKQDKTKQVNRIEEKNNLVDDVVQSSPDKKIYFLDVVNEKIKKLSDNNIEDIKIINRLKSLIEEISKQKSCVVNSKPTETAEILETFVDLFIGTDNEIIERITNIFEKIDNAENIFNKFKYSVGVLYNQAKQVVSKC